jgi:hypothetical protein
MKGKIVKQNKLPNSKISFSENKRLIATQYKYYKCSIQNEYFGKRKTQQHKSSLPITCSFR